MLPHLTSVAFVDTWYTVSFELPGWALCETNFLFCGGENIHWVVFFCVYNSDGNKVLETLMCSATQSRLRCSKYNLDTFNIQNAFYQKSMLIW